MTPPIVVSNASPLIALERIGRLDLIPVVFHQVVVPPAVGLEVGPEIFRNEGIVERALGRPINPRVAAARLDVGESQALSLALELRASQIVLDDEPARRLARALDLPLIGTIGTLLAAKHRGVIPAVEPLVKALVGTGFRLDDWLYEFVLAEAGER